MEVLLDTCAQQPRISCSPPLLWTPLGNALGIKVGQCLLSMDRDLGSDVLLPSVISDESEVSSDNWPSDEALSGHVSGCQRGRQSIALRGGSCCHTSAASGECDLTQVHTDSTAAEHDPKLFCGLARLPLQTAGEWTRLLSKFVHKG